MLRLHVPRVEGPIVRLTGSDLRHVRAHRLAVGDRLVLFDDVQLEHEAVLERIDPGHAVARIVAVASGARESSREIILVAALLKGAKMDLVVEKATELGAAAIHPITTARVIALGTHPERWHRLAVAAAKQSGRTSVPAIAPVATFDAILAAPLVGPRLLVWEGERSRRLATVPDTLGAVTVIVGPEGGFTDGEVARARAHAAVTVGLGPRVLRAETAAIVAVALCQHRFGDG